MNNLHLSKEAQNDLAEIKAYITEELENPDAALAAAIICVFCSVMRRQMKQTNNSIIFPAPGR